MREIKFRALGLSKMRQGWNFGSSDIEKYFNTDKRDNHMFLTTFERLLRGGILDKNTRCQYTGLLDKNGVEIYMGDIIKVLGTECTVIWEQGAFKFQKNTECYYIQHLSDFATSDKCVAYEVIGNIYENPELLEGAK